MRSRSQARSDRDDSAQAAYRAHHRRQADPLGSGEGAQGPAVAAIANAFAHATGKRLRDLPFTPERVKGILS